MMTPILEKIALFISVALMIVISYWLGQQSYNWMPVAATAEAKHVDDLFSFLVALGSFIFLGVVGMIVFSIITCRADENDYTEGHPSRGNNKLEFFWTATPTILVLWIGWQSFNIYQQLDIEGLNKIIDLKASESGNKSMLIAQKIPNQIEEIEVIAKQWDWTFRYPQSNITTSELHLPQNKRVRLILESEDVIHGFYVPEFRFKQDMIPNHRLNFTFTPLKEGKYKLHDSQFSGTYFALMEADVYIDSPEAYGQWLQSAHNNILKPSLAATEHAHQPRQLIRSDWPTIEPATPFVAQQ
ncbi:cytochrome c oxidase subunit II [Crocosphaera sp. UHCC 0190]|uniref:cytochrome c oxidase subunit II n=1 Tax=Crocosphaera sp. UHCC 0190 TaxID=3110246 RepID=UPI002B20026D|nr:cytochrome c oxidase subunit II [Crocosphaera sp. UHCC 0190]MEA5508740.1 cytochrome c oxidase subunit II [Crocosphaera sp. UHCC 0190]